MWVRISEGRVDRSGTRYVLRRRERMEEVIDRIEEEDDIRRR